MTVNRTAAAAGTPLREATLVRAVIRAAAAARPITGQEVVRLVGAASGSHGDARWR